MASAECVVLLSFFVVMVRVPELGVSDGVFFEDTLGLVPRGLSDEAVFPRSFTHAAEFLQRVPCLAYFIFQLRDLFAAHNEFEIYCGDYHWFGVLGLFDFANKRVVATPLKPWDHFSRCKPESPHPLRSVKEMDRGGILDFLAPH